MKKQNIESDNKVFDKKQELDKQKGKLLFIKKQKEKEITQRKQRVRKPRTLHDSEIHTGTYLINLKENEQSLFQNIYSEEDLKNLIDIKNFIQLSNCYGFLTDAILSYLRLYADDRATGIVSMGKYVPDDPKDAMELDDIITIKDSFSNFCNHAGVTNHNQKSLLLKEIKNNHFSQIGITNLNLKKSDFSFTSASFLTYKFTYKECSKLKNLKNINHVEAIDTIKLTLNKNIFQAALIKNKKSKTRGFYLYPEFLERWLRQTVKEHKDELIQYCRENNFKYLKGGDYTNSIRPLFNLLIREERGQPVVIDGITYQRFYPKIKTYASSCCEFAFFTVKKTGKQKFKKARAIENLKYAFKVLQFLYEDGTKRILIKNFQFIDDKIIVDILNHNTLQNPEINAANHHRRN
jgi:hypothetical protein